MLRGTSGLGDGEREEAGPRPRLPAQAAVHLPVSLTA